MNATDLAGVPIGRGRAGAAGPGRVVLTWISTGRGGAERSVIELATGLAACGLSTTVLWWATDIDGGRHPLPGPGVTVLPVATPAQYTATLARLVAVDPSATVVVSSHRTALTDLTVAGAGPGSAPVVPVLRAMLLDGQALRVLAPASGTVTALDPGRWPWPRLAGAACWPAVSTAAARSLARFLPAGAPIRVIYNGVGPVPSGSTASPGRASAGTLRRPGDPLRCAAVARAIAWKRVDALVDAFAALPPGVARLDVYGDGPDLPRLRRLVAGQGIPVQLHGHVPDLPARLLAADVLVSGSRSEAFPGLLTALAAADPAVLTAAGTAARARAVGLFTPARCAAQYLDLCHTLTTAAGTAPETTAPECGGAAA